MTAILSTNSICHQLSCTYTTSRSSLIALLPIRSCPAAFLGFRRLIDSIVSAEVKGSIGGDVWKGMCRYSVTSAAALEEWGLNTLDKYLANRSAFSIGRPSTLRTADWRDYLWGAREFPGGFP
ncbi:uncharacterized protein LOC117151262 [Bombus impatiens]|uniref:Uncharacterized protein LOC117151262 n=1 Tax=Bombus impatiens TaxID=132113 RepID=A0A6P8L9M2_BOMIM|nr:uncharacterized protein LOC117151262 [Bombus impatiens]